MHLPFRETGLGDDADIPDLVRTLDIDAVLVSADAMDAADLRRLGWQLTALPAAADQIMAGASGICCSPATPQES